MSKNNFFKWLYCSSTQTGYSTLGCKGQNHLEVTWLAPHCINLSGPLGGILWSAARHNLSVLVPTCGSGSHIFCTFSFRCYTPTLTHTLNVFEILRFCFHIFKILGGSWYLDWAFLLVYLFSLSLSLPFYENNISFCDNNYKKI